MFPSNLHTHTTYSDGSLPPESYVRAAIELGFVSIGFSEHQPTLYKCRSEMKIDRIPEYLGEIARLKEKYAGRIQVLLGLEADVYGTLDTDELGLDYVIGAVHWLKKSDGTYGSMDGSPGGFEELLEAFGGIRNLAEEYYARLADVVKSRPDILAHFDLITKFNSSNKYFDPEEKWYKELVHPVIDLLVDSNIVVEINTGAIARGYSKTPYPHKYILLNLAKKNIPITISADAHSPKHLCHGFSEAALLAKSTGNEIVMVYQDAGFKEVSLKSL